MEEDALRSRLFVAMRFIAEVVLRSGMTAREFIEITKMAFVDAQGEFLERWLL